MDRKRPGGTCLALSMVIISWLHKCFVEICKNKTGECKHGKKPWNFKSVNS